MIGNQFERIGGDPAASWTQGAGKRAGCHLPGGRLAVGGRFGCSGGGPSAKAFWLASLARLWRTSGLPLACLLPTSGPPLACLWPASGLLLACIWHAPGLPLDCLWPACGLLLACLWPASGPPLACLSPASRLPLACLWPAPGPAPGLPLACPWLASRLPLACLWPAFALPLGFSVPNPMSPCVFSSLGSWVPSSLWPALACLWPASGLQGLSGDVWRALRLRLQEGWASGCLGPGGQGPRRAFDQH
jgi:hypothetical protein